MINAIFSYFINIQACTSTHQGSHSFTIKLIFHHSHEWFGAKAEKGLHFLSSFLSCCHFPNYLLPKVLKHCLWAFQFSYRVHQKKKKSQYFSKKLNWRIFTNSHLINHWNHSFRFVTSTIVKRYYPTFCSFFFFF